MKRVVFLPTVASDIAEIAACIAKDNPERAISFGHELEARAREAGRNPKRFRVRFVEKGEVRAASLGRYRIYFCERLDRVEIRRVVHTARDARRLVK